MPLLLPTCIYVYGYDELAGIVGHIEECSVSYGSRYGVVRASSVIGMSVVRGGLLCSQLAVYSTCAPRITERPCWYGTLVIYILLVMIYLAVMGL